MKESELEGRNEFIAAREERLDRLVADFVAQHASLKGISRSQVKRWIEHGLVTVGGVALTKAGALVREGALVRVTVPELETQSLVSYECPLDIRFEDEELLVIEKPAGLSMHPGAGNSSTTLVNALLGLFRSRGAVPEALQQDSVVSEAIRGGAKVTRPGIVHRLDKDTTGLVVVAKTLRAHAALARQFAERTVGRRYMALAFCTPRGKRPFDVQDQGMIDAPLVRHPTRRKEMSIASQPRLRGKAPSGKRAVTHWRVLERLGYACLVEARLETGRTHQIRIHFSSIGCPLIGDKTYGDFSGLPLSLRRFHEGLGRQALHAGMLEFTHPISGKRLSFSSDMPEDMTAVVEGFRVWRAP